MKTNGILNSSLFQKNKLRFTHNSDTQTHRNSHTKLTSTISQFPSKKINSKNSKQIKSLHQNQNSISKLNESTSHSNHIKSQCFYSNVNKCKSSKIPFEKLNNTSHSRMKTEKELSINKRFSSTFNLSNSISNQFKHIKLNNKPIKKNQKTINNNNDIRNAKQITQQIIMTEDNSPPINMNLSQSEISLSNKKSIRIEHNEISVMEEITKSNNNKHNSKQSNHNSNKISKKNSLCNIIENYYNNNAATSDNTNNVLDDNESNFLNYDLGNIHNISKLPEISSPTEFINKEQCSNKFDEREYDLNKVYKNIRKLNILNSFDSCNDYSLYHLNTNEFKKNETISKIYIDTYKNNNKWENVSKTNENIIHKTNFIKKYDNLFLNLNCINNDSLIKDIRKSNQKRKI